MLILSILFLGDKMKEQIMLVGSGDGFGDGYGCGYGSIGSKLK